MGFKIGESGSVTLKALTIGAIVLVLLVPLTMLKGLVNERSALREQAYIRVAEGWGGSIEIGGPMLIVPTERKIAVEEEAGNIVTRVVRSNLYLLPAKLEMDVALNLEDEPRYVGIYAVPVYLANVDMKGEFDFAALQASIGKPGVTYLWHESRLRLPLSHVHGLREVGQATFAGNAVDLGPAGPGIYRGIETPIDLSEHITVASTAFQFRAVVAGSRHFAALPLGSVTTMRMRSNWPHPSFDGAFLPVDHGITASDFNARWQVLELNRPYRQAWIEGEVDEAALTGSAFGVSLYQPVDIYQRGERAIKYALLFIALTFLTFFAWEQVAAIRLHPLQYLLVGLALSTFYLLLIALSEHVAFAVAYALAAVALVLLIGLYIAGVLRSSARGIISGAAMTAVYGLLYVLVLSEDYALLLGAIVLFAALAAVMLVTRKVDWYRLSPRSQPEQA
jgi:inner membrane protein